MVIYRAIANFEGYRVGNDGSVWTRRSRNGRGPLKKEWRRMKADSKYNRYERLGLYKNGKQISVSVHTLVLEAFVGPCPEGMEARHLDGNAFNNLLSNLTWGTKLDNAKDKIKHGTSGKGETNGRAKLDTEAVLRIRRLAKIMTGKQLAAKFKVTPTMISFILSRKSWSHI
jgi:hypothetical protein